MKALLLLIVSLFLPAFLCFGQVSTMMPTDSQFKEASVIAQKSLGDLIQLAQQVEIKTLGFDNQKQLRQAKVGIPVTDYQVRLDELQDYQPGTPPAQLLHATGRLIYPLETDRQVRSSVVLVPAQEKWVIESFGAPKQTRLVTELRKAVAKKERRAEAEFFQVRIPALNLLFIGFERNDELYLSPLFNQSRYGLSSGERYPAAKLFEKLREAARQHNGEPS